MCLVLSLSSISLTLITVISKQFQTKTLSKAYRKFPCHLLHTKEVKCLAGFSLGMKAKTLDNCYGRKII